MKAIKFTFNIFIITLLILITSQSVWRPRDISDRARVFTRPLEFDYFYWTILSLWEKGGQSALSVARFLSLDQQRRIVDDFMELLNKLRDVDRAIIQVYSNPEIKEPRKEAQPILNQKQKLEGLFNQRAPLAESVLQFQISVILSAKGLNFAGQTFPPVLFRMSELPDQLIISPRNVIREDASISLQPGLTAQQMHDLEMKVSDDLNVSALVVPLGGVGVYPTMVYRETSIDYLLKVVAHEWIHNYLTFRPLGWHYDENPQLRTMNETTADICGTEISRAALRYFYPDKAPPSPYSSEDLYEVKNTLSRQEETFVYQKEMHATRVHVDELLALGKIEEAESYMEMRRKIFWEHGYQIRKLNQAYFAFYGAYAEEPLGAAGNDPVGPAVRLLRDRSANMTEFLHRIARMTSFEELQKALAIY